MPCQHLIHTLSPFKSTSGRCTQLTESSTSKRWWRAPWWGCSHSSLSTDSHTVRGHQWSRELLWASFPEQGSTRSVGWITSGWTDQKWIVTQQRWFLQLLKSKAVTTRTDWTAGDGRKTNLPRVTVCLMADTPLYVTTAALCRSFKALLQPQHCPSAEGNPRRAVFKTQNIRSPFLGAELSMSTDCFSSQGNG